METLAPNTYSDMAQKFLLIRFAIWDDIELAMYMNKIATLPRNYSTALSMLRIKKQAAIDVLIHEVPPVTHKKQKNTLSLIPIYIYRQIQSKDEIKRHSYEEMRAKVHVDDLK
jgi:hypothetical protein